MMIGRIVWINILVMVITVALCILVIEFSVQFYFGEKFESRPVFYQHDAELGWVPAPNLDHRYYGSDFDISIRTDSDGHRLGALGELDSKSNLVVLAGDSYMFGWGVNTDETLASNLDELMAKRYGVRAVNLGVGCYGVMQSALRMERLTTQIDTTRIKAVIVLHAHNDMTDNVKFLMFQNGMRAPEDLKRGNPSYFHSINLLRNLVNNVFSKKTDRGRDQSLYVKDVLFNVPLKRIEIPTRQIRVTESFSIESDSLTYEETKPQLAFERRAFTPLQRVLMRDSIDRVNCAYPGRDLPIIHTLIHSAPAWYVDTIWQVVDASDSCGNRIVFAGQVPVAGQFTGEIRNRHSGAHFAPALNRYYAEVFAAWLSEYLRSK